MCFSTSVLEKCLIEGTPPHLNKKRLSGPRVWAFFLKIRKLDSAPGSRSISYFFIACFGVGEGWCWRWREVGRGCWVLSFSVLLFLSWLLFLSLVFTFSLSSFSCSCTRVCFCACSCCCSCSCSTYDNTRYLHTNHCSSVLFVGAFCIEFLMFPKTKPLRFGAPCVWLVCFLHRQN